MKYVVTSHVDVGNNSQKLMDTYTLMSWVSEKLIFFNQNMLKEISSAFWCRSLWSKHSGNKSGSHAPFTRVVAWGCQMCSANILKVMHYCLWFDIMSMYFALMIEYKRLYGLQRRWCTRPRNFLRLHHWRLTFCSSLLAWNTKQGKIT